MTISEFQIKMDIMNIKKYCIMLNCEIKDFDIICHKYNMSTYYTNIIDNDTFLNLIKEICKRSNINLNDIDFVYNGDYNGVCKRNNQYQNFKESEYKIYLSPNAKNETCIATVYLNSLHQIEFDYGTVFS